MRKNFTSVIRFTLALSVLLLISLVSVLGQAPGKFSYQAILRDADGVIRDSESVSIQLVIHQGSETGTQVYSEVQNVETNSFGLVNLEVGTIDPTSFSLIDWSTGSYFLEMIVNGSSMGTSMLLSVPYALYAESGNPGPQGDPGIQGEMGATGNQGATGSKGDTGDAGAAGPQGEKGNKGDTGDTGSTGATGPKGDQGDPGPQGDKGDPGDTRWNDVTGGINYGLGNVGIGTTSPDSKLHVMNGTVTFDVYSGSSSYAKFSSIGGGYAQMYLNTGSANTIGLRSQGSSFFNGGNVGIGTTSPAAKLVVYNNSSSYLQTNLATGQAYHTLRGGTHTWKVGLSYSTGGNWYMIEADGNSLLQINQSGTMNIYGDPVYLRTTYNNPISSGRDLYISSIGELGYLSSAKKYKTNIRPMGDYSSDIFDLSPVLYDALNGDGKDLVGLIAEDVEIVMPELVSYNKEGELETVYYSKLVPLLLNEIIKLKTEVEDMRQMLEGQ